MIRTKIYILLLFVAFTLNAQNQIPKNIIFLIGDGMGINYVAASYLNDKNNPYKDFKSIGFSVTQSADKLITDSAAGATVLATGYRTLNRYISIDSTGNPLKTIFQFAKEKGKSVGLVVTSSVTNATPAAFYAHIDDRGRETDIAFQLSQTELDLIIGGGKQFFLPDVIGGSRKDDMNLIDSMQFRGWNFFEKFDGQSIAVTDKVLCLLEKNGLKHSSDRYYTLGEMTKAALDNLSNNQNGFVLLVEGSQIDWAGHDNNQEYLLSEMKDFNSAIKIALDFAKKNGETLVVVTADHETGGMSIIGGDFDGNNLKIGFINKSHSAGFVPIFSFGPSEELLRGVLENYEIGRNLIHLVNPSVLFYPN